VKITTQGFWVAGDWPGRLGIVTRPRGGDWLADEMAAWRAAGIDEVVSLLEPHEVRELELALEPDLCRRHGMQHHAFPVADRGVPESGAQAVELALALLKSLRRGRSVAVHCRQGIGRSASLVALVLSLSGVMPDQAFLAVQQARGCPVPDTGEQRAWVTRVARSIPVEGVRLAQGVREPGDE
jgi:protein-tyrosine phosphatase